MKKRNVRTLSLIVVTFTYLLIGAAIFDALEGGHNEQAYEALQTVKSTFIEKYNVTNEDYKIMELLIIEKKPHKSGPQWKFAGSFYYALVVLTLIGYGHSTPATNLGKAFTMCYAAAGIPMAMVMFQSMGERMNKFYSVIIKKFRSWGGSARTDATEFDLILASGITSSIVIWSGAVLYHTQEGWPFFDSLYYTFITLSTIGFGDFVALQKNQALQFRPGYVFCSFVFLLLGLAALSSSINLLVLRFMILSLEEEEEDDLQNAGQVVTLDGEIMAVNGRVLTGQQMVATSERNIFQASGGSGSGSGDAASVCSCTCYGSRSRSGRQPSRGEAVPGTTTMTSTQPRQLRHRGSRPTARSFLWCIGRTLGCKESLEKIDEENFYDEETQSISNCNRFAVKRASF